MHDSFYALTSDALTSIMVYRFPSIYTSGELRLGITAHIHALALARRVSVDPFFFEAQSEESAPVHWPIHTSSHELYRALNSPLLLLKPCAISVPLQAPIWPRCQ